MADDKKATPAVKKTLSKKAMKSTRGCGVMVPERGGNLIVQSDGVMVPDRS